MPARRRWRHLPPRADAPARSRRRGITLASRDDSAARSSTKRECLITTETRPATSQGIDYTRIDSAVGLNWYDADPNLQQIVERLAAPDDRAFAEEHLRRTGGVMGGPIAARAEITDKNPPTMDFGEARDGAMFRTEIKGGSDLASSECSAMKAKDGWRINGSKSFCSNLDAVAILALARPEGGHPGLQPA